MRKYRIALIEWQTVFGDKIRSPSVQVRVGLFWWLTLTHCETVKQANFYIESVKKRKAEKVIRILKPGEKCISKKILDA
ncbi:MAG: hypothetical protein E5Y74_00030 [Mesorhizobium sp.]|nr:MAG: hypothetical protein E5Y74_00030 [Mesorhizobium sp.]